MNNQNQIQQQQPKFSMVLQAPKVQNLINNTLKDGEFIDCAGNIFTVSGNNVKIIKVSFYVQQVS